MFFTEFFSDDYLNNVEYKTFCKDLYTSYDETNGYIEEKYNIRFNKSIQEKIQRNIEDSKKEKKMDNEKGINILPIEELDKFIEYVSSIDIDKYIK